MKGADPLIWLLIDGLSWELMQRHRVRGKQNGQLARCPLYPVLPLSPNCQTPPSLFSIFSGVDVDRHGLTGYPMPAPTAAQPLAVADTFEVWPRDIAMVWDDWAHQGICFRLCAVPFVQPQRLGAMLISQSCPYEGLTVNPEIIEHGGYLHIAPLLVHARLNCQANGATLHWHDQNGVATYWLALGSTVHVTLPVHSTPGNAYQAIALRLVCIEGRICLVSFGFRQVSATAPQAPVHNAYVANDLTRLYRAGDLGLRMDEGGHGAAEWLLLELMREMHESFCADIVGAIAAADAQRVIGYYPVVDLLSHHLLKYIDATWASETMQQVGQCLFDEVLGWVDDLLMRCLAAAGQPVSCIAHSDHGMAAVHDDLFPNAFFETRGWLVYDHDGLPDPDKSAALFHPADNGLVLFNQRRLALSGDDPHTVTEAWRQSLPCALREGWSMFEHLGGPLFAHGWSGINYWQAPKGARLLAVRSTRFVRPSRKGGDHTVHANDPWLRGMLIDASTTSLPAPADVLTLPAISRWLLHGQNQAASEQDQNHPHRPLKPVPEAQEQQSHLGTGKEQRNDDEPQCVD